MIEHHFEVPRTARFYTLGEIEAASDVWFVLHGYSMLARNFLKWFEPARAPGRLIVAPEALSRSYFDERKARRVGASWMTKELREAEIEDYVGYLDLLAARIFAGVGQRPRVELHGFSQGAVTAARWAALGQTAFDRIVLWGGSTPPDLELARLGRAVAGGELQLIVGETDQYLTNELVSAEMQRLEAAEIPARLTRFAGGHAVDRETLCRLASVPPG